MVKRRRTKGSEGKDMLGYTFLILSKNEAICAMDMDLVETRQNFIGLQRF